MGDHTLMLDEKWSGEKRAVCSCGWEGAWSDQGGQREEHAAHVRLAVAPAGAGGTCPTCGADYPRRLPIDQDQRCWSCWLDNDPSEADHG